MKRRRAILGISILAGGAFLSYLGFKWVKLTDTPDFSRLIDNKKLIAELADIIIPRSDSPSASDCKVDDFIIKMVTECTDVVAQNNFMNGLSELAEYSKSSFEKSFEDCSAAEKNSIVSYFAEHSALRPGLLGKIEKRVTGKPFFTILKEYTVIGYFTSQGGATQALRYVPVPSAYHACEPYAPGEKGWATY